MTAIYTKINQNAEPTLALLRELFPQTFFIDEKAIKPLKVGIHKDLFDALEGKITRMSIRGALALYTQSPAYKPCIQPGAERIDLEGKVCGVIEEPYQEYPRKTKKTKKLKAPIKGKGKKPMAAGAGKRPPNPKGQFGQRRGQFGQRRTFTPQAETGTPPAEGQGQGQHQYPPSQYQQPSGNFQPRERFNANNQEGRPPRPPRPRYPNPNAPDFSSGVSFNPTNNTFSSPQQENRFRAPFKPNNREPLLINEAQAARQQQQRPVIKLKKRRKIETDGNDESSSSEE